MTKYECENDFREIRDRSTDVITTWIDDNIDYEIVISTRVYDNGSIDHEILEQHIKHLDDDGVLRNTIPVKLPEKYIKEAEEFMERKLLW